MDPESGRITIDNVDITSVPISELRALISIIPQDPLLFSGTLLQNLDPTGVYGAEKILEVLERCGVRAAVMKRTGAWGEITRAHPQARIVIFIWM